MPFFALNIKFIMQDWDLSRRKDVLGNAKI